jgi:ankyrin repeat protein
MPDVRHHTCRKASHKHLNPRTMNIWKSLFRSTSKTAKAASAAPGVPPLSEAATSKPSQPGMNEKSPDPNEELIEASARGDAAEVQNRLNQGADVNAWVSEKTPLSEAAYYGHTNIVELLVSKGADVNAKRTRSGHTALNGAAAKGRKDVVEFLLAHGAALNGLSGETPLHSAAMFGHRNVVEVLLAKGAEVNTLNSYGETALERAVYYLREYSNRETVEALRRHGGVIKGGYANYGEFESYRRPE